MRGVGVGESTATPLAAAITWILKDGTGMIGRIIFAWWQGYGNFDNLIVNLDNDVYVTYCLCLSI